MDSGAAIPSAVRHDLLRNAYRLREMGLQQTDHTALRACLEDVVQTLNAAIDRLPEENASEDGNIEVIGAKASVAPRPSKKGGGAMRIAGLHHYLKSRIRGQNETLDRIAKAITRSELGMAEPNHPRTSMIFLGPTGVGKTETAIQLAEFLYHDREALERLDMAEYSDATGISKMLGRDESEKGALEKALENLETRASGEKRPKGGILLFDEIEKASAAVTKLFLSILDAGRFTTTAGQTIRVNDYVMLFTSNLGGKEAAKMRNVPYSTLERTVRNAASRFFAPEMFARFTEVCVFRPLSLDTQWEIAKMTAQKELKALEQSTSIRQEPLSEEVLRHLVANGFDAQLGARPMRNFVRQQIGDAFAELLIQDHRQETIESVKYAMRGQKLIATR